MPNRNRQRGNFADDTDGRRDRKDRNRERIDRARERDRIEARRDRRQDRRERNQERRDVVETIRSPKEDLRVDRIGSRLMPIEDSFLGQPVGVPHDLPVLIGERWGLDADATITTSTDTTIVWDTPSFTTERNGYPRIYQGSGNWRIPAGLSGIWQVTMSIFWDAHATGSRVVFLEYTDETTITSITNPAIVAVGFTQMLTTVYKFNEGDEFRCQVFQDRGGNLVVQGSPDRTWMFAHFLGK